MHYASARRSIPTAGRWLRGLLAAGGRTGNSCDLWSAETDEHAPPGEGGAPWRGELGVEACIELMAEDAILAIQDMGAAGLTSSSVEMAAKGGSGIDLDLDRVPQREQPLR